MAISVWTTDEWIEHITRGSNEHTNSTLLTLMRNILHNRGVQCRSAGDFLSIQLFRTNYEFLANVSVTLIHVCSTFDFRKSIFEAGLVERNSGVDT